MKTIKEEAKDQRYGMRLNWGREGEKERLEEQEEERLTQEGEAEKAQNSSPV